VSAGRSLDEAGGKRADCHKAALQISRLPQEKPGGSKFPGYQDVSSSRKTRAEVRSFREEFREHFE
jgi:hypothetical protein